MNVVLTFAERRTNFCGGILCCWTTTGESVMGICSLFRGLKILAGLSSLRAQRAQECPSTLDIICNETQRKKRHIVVSDQKKKKGVSDQNALVYTSYTTEEQLMVVIHLNWTSESINCKFLMCQPEFPSRVSWRGRSHGWCTTECHCPLSQKQPLTERLQDLNKEKAKEYYRQIWILANGVSIRQWADP